MTKVSITKRFTFEAAHHLPNHPKCGTTHGHSYKLWVTVTGDVQSNGMVMDFHELKELVGTFVRRFDHQDLNTWWSIPTAEQIAKYMLNFFHSMDERVVKVQLWETEDSYVEAEWLD